MAQVKRVSILVAALAMLLMIAVPAFAAGGSQPGKQVEGTFRLNLHGPLPKGQTFYVRQRGMDTDPTAPICTTAKSMSHFAQTCARGENDLPFVAPKGTNLRYNIYRYDNKTGQREVLARGVEVVRRGSLIEASYRSF